jgi:hypothetical protein
MLASSTGLGSIGIWQMAAVAGAEDGHGRWGLRAAMRPTGSST